MGRSGCSSCCAEGDPPERSDCILKDNVFMYTLDNGDTLETEEYIDKLAENQREQLHEHLRKVTQSIDKRDYGEYRTEINAFSWSPEFDVVSHERKPKGPFDFDYLKHPKTRDSAGYFVPKRFHIAIGKHISIRRELQIVKTELVSSGESYGIADWQYTPKGVHENGGDIDMFKAEAGKPDSIEKGCPSERNMINQHDTDINAAFGQSVIKAARGGSLFSSFPRDRTNIQIKKITYSLAYKQTVDAANSHFPSSGPGTLSRGIPVLIEYRAYNFGEELFISGSTCGNSGPRCTPTGGPIVIPTEKLVEDEDTIKEFLEEYRTLTYCLTYPFLKMEDGTYWFSSPKQGEVGGGKVTPYPHEVGEPDLRTGGPLTKKALQATHHWHPGSFTSIKVTNNEFFWLNPFAWNITKTRQDPNDGLGKTLTEEDWHTRFLLKNKKVVPVPKPPAGEDEDDYDAYKEELRELLVEKEQETYIKGPYFEFVDNKLKGNEYDIPQKMFMHVRGADILYNVYDQITTGEEPAGRPNDFNWLYPNPLGPQWPDETREKWTKWHEDIIVVQIRSQRSAESWLKRSTVNGATVRVADDVYYPVGSCEKKRITRVITGPTQRPESVILDDNTPHTFDEIELVKDTITYGMDGRVYRMWMWFMSVIQGDGKTFDSDWYPEPDPFTGKIIVKQTPLTHKIKKIWYHNHTRPFPVGPEVSSYNRYPTNDTVINFTDEVSFAKMVGKSRDFRAKVINIENTGPCSISPEDWILDYSELDSDDKDQSRVARDFYYFNDENKPEARLLSDDDVIVMGEKMTSENLANKVGCVSGGRHWDLPTWVYYYPEKGGGIYLEPEMEEFDCRANPWKATYKHEFRKEQSGNRNPYIGKKKSAEFEITQTPNRGYLFTGEGYTIKFEFEEILTWRERILDGLEGN